MSHQYEVLSHDILLPASVGELIMMNIWMYKEIEFLCKARH